MNRFKNRVSRLSAEQKRQLWQLIDDEKNPTSQTSGRDKLCAFVTVDSDSRNTDSAALRDYLKARLPGYMVPDRVNIIDSVPHLSNGKIDYQSLKDDSADAPDNDRELVNPESETEKLLADIWSELLGLDFVGIHDNFLELGGDSITSIQMVSRAREAGLNIDPRQVSEFATISELAAVVRFNKGSDDNTGRRTGHAPLSPIQHWFLNRDLSAANHWNQARLLEVQPQITSEILSAAVDFCVNHHDALRASFQRHDSEWIQTIADSETTSLMQVEHCRADEFFQRAAECMGAFDLARGPLMRFVLFPFHGQQSAQLLIIAHHLIIDHVSWSILLRDLEQLCSQVHDDQELALPAKTTSAIQWTEELTAWSNGGECRASADYWKKHADELSHRLPTDFSPDREPDEDSADAVTIEFDESCTGKLLTEANKAYGTQANELLLTALAITLTEWAGRSSIRIDLEGHGREPIFDGIDIGETVGWFTSFFPVTLEVPPADSPAPAIKGVKEELRRLPNRGLDYGALRYLSNDSQIGDALAAAPHAQVLFNYAGVDAGTNSGRLLKPLKLDCAPTRAPHNARSHLLEINAAVIGQKLTVRWIFSNLVHGRSTIQHVAELFRSALQRLIIHCTTSDVKGFTPSDFPETGLNQDELDQFLDEFE